MGTITRSFANNITSGGTFDATDLTGTIPSSNIANASVGNITDVPALVTTTKESSDPPSPVNGQIWYNTTDRVLRGYVLGAGSWASGGSLNTAREKLGGAGTQTAALGFAGVTPSLSYSSITESYDGTSWTEVNDLNTAKQSVAGAGTQTSAICAGGENSGGNTSDTELFNGTSWTEVNNMNTGRFFPGSSGTQTAALAFGGYVAAPTGITESWNGTSWTEVNDMNTGRYSIQGAGTQTDSIVAGGATPSPVGNVELWNGTSWTETTDLNTGRRGAGASSLSTTSSNVIFFGGNALPPSTFTGTEKWDGTSWTEVNDLSTGRAEMRGAGTTSAALAYGGVIPPQSAATEEWTQSLVTTTLGAS